MPFSLPKPALSSVTVQTPDFSAAADTARRPDVGAQKSSTFDDLLSRHAEQVEQTRAATPKAVSAETPKPRPATTEKHKLAERNPDKPAKADKSPAKSADKPADTAAAKTEPDQPADTASTQVASNDDAKTADTTAQTQADPTTTSADAPTDAATQAAAVLAAQAQAQAQTQIQATAPTDTNAEAQLAAVTPQADLSAKGPAQPAAPDAATPDAAAAEASANAATDTPADPNAAPADFAALLGQAAVVPGATAAAPAPTPTSAKSGKPTTEKIAATRPDATPVLADFGKAAPAGKDTATAPAKAVNDPSVTQTTTPFDKDQTLASRFGDARDPAQQTQTAPQPQVPITPQTVAQIAADAAPLPAAKPADASAQNAFSIQTTAADVPGGYSATGAQTASATTLSKAAIDNMGAMGLQISKKLAEGTTRFTLELHPADLGKVEVALNIGRDGKTTAHMRFDNPVTASAFSANEGELRQQLANAGLKLDSDALSFSSRDGDSSGQAFAQMFQGQEQASHGRAARALQTAGDQADQIDADTALNTALAEFRNRPANSTLALNLVV